MKIAIVGDVHMCRINSIINKQGERFSKRLENCVATISWAERTADEKGCKLTVYLGDFFDRPELDDETLTALKSIDWHPTKKLFIVGNHESSVSSLVYNSVNVLSSDNADVISEFTHITIPGGEGNGESMLFLLPYVTEADRRPLREYYGDLADWKKTHSGNRILLMHNDIAGIEMGPITTKSGFTKEEIMENSELCVDGHLHNGVWLVPNRLRTLGNVTGLDFGEDACRYGHNMMVLDTDTLEYEDIENPYAFNFYKVDVMNEKDLDWLCRLKDNAVLSIRCKDGLLDKARERLNSLSNVSEYRIIVSREGSDGKAEADLADLTTDHMQKFVECCKAKLDNTKLLDEELAEICK